MAEQEVIVGNESSLVLPLKINAVLSSGGVRSQIQSFDRSPLQAPELRRYLVGRE